MSPADFPQANARYTAPRGYTEEQVRTISAFHGRTQGGSLDGDLMVVTAWQPTPGEAERIARGLPIFLTFLGGLPPHTVTTSFEEATSIQ